MQNIIDLLWQDIEKMEALVKELQAIAKAFRKSERPLEGLRFKERKVKSHECDTESDRNS